MSVSQRIPIIIGVTGHRDIRERDVPVLKSVLQFQFAELKKAFPFSPLHLLTGLAEGADSLAAEAAIEFGGITLMAVLPFAAEIYKEDFATSMAKARLARLLAASTNVFVCDFVSADKAQQYAAVGRHIARHAQIVFAMWDGVDGKNGEAPLTGGTAHVVRMCRSGVRSSMPLALPEPTRLVHIFALRESLEPSATMEGRVGNIVETSLREHLDPEMRLSSALNLIERFNHAIFRSSKTTDADTDYCSDDKSDLSAAIFAHADPIALARQRQRRLGVVFVATLVLISAFFHQIYSGPDMRVGWLYAHIATAVAAIVCFRLIFRSKRRWDQEYLDWRAIAEGLRVQTAWRATGVDADVADHYFAEDSDDLAWLRIAIRNIGLVTPHDATKNVSQLSSVWLTSQRDFYGSRTAIMTQKDARYSIVARILLYAGLFGTLWTAFSHSAGLFVDHLNIFLLVSGGLFLSAAAIRTIADQLNYGELKNRYRLMAQLFDVAIVRFDERVSFGDIDGGRDIIFIAGKEALAENAGWLRIHRQRQFEVNIS